MAPPLLSRLGLPRQLTQGPPAKADAASKALSAAMDLGQVVWSVDWTLNGVSLQAVYAERVPQPLATPHAKAAAAGERARKYTQAQGSRSREPRVALHWPPELLSGTSLSLQPGDCLTVLAKASYVAPDPRRASAAAGGGGRLTPRLGMLGLGRRAPLEPSAPSLPEGGAALGKRFFTRDVSVRVPDKLEAGAISTRAAESGVCLTHADYRSYMVTFRKAPTLGEQLRRSGAGRAAIDRLAEEAADSDGEEAAGGVSLEALTVLISLHELLADFRRNVAPADPSGAASPEPDDSRGASRLACEMVRNLDTGEVIHLSEVAERVPSGVGPEAMHWLAHEEERAARLRLPFLSSSVDMRRCAPPLPLLGLHGSAQSGSSVRAALTLDRYSHGVADPRLASLAVSLATWRRHPHYGAAEQPRVLGVERGAARGGAAASRCLDAADIGSTVGVTCTLASAARAGLCVEASAYSAVVGTAAALRDAVDAALVLEESRFDVSLDEQLSMQARLARSAEGDEGPPSSAASQWSDGCSDAGSEGGARPGRQLRLSAAVGARVRAGRASLADKLAERRWPGKGGGAQPRPATAAGAPELRACSLQVGRQGVTLVQSRVRQRVGRFDRTRAGAAEGGSGVAFEPDEEDGARRRFVLVLDGKAYGLLAQSGWHRDVIGLVVARRAQLAATLSADACGCAPLLYEPPALQCAGEPLGVRPPRIGDELELAAARVDYADGCAVQWWRVHPGGQRVPIAGAAGPRYRLSADDAYCRLEVVCKPFREADERGDGAGRLLGHRPRVQGGGAARCAWGCPSVSALHAAALPTPAHEEAVRSAHSWEYAKLAVQCVPLASGVPPLYEQARCLPRGTAGALGAAGCLGAHGDGRQLHADAWEAPAGESCGLQEYTCVLSKKELSIRQSGVLVLSSALCWQVRSGLAARIPLWDRPLVELAEDELDGGGDRLLLWFGCLEERDRFVLAFHYLVFHGLQTQHLAQAAGRGLHRG